MSGPAKHASLDDDGDTMIARADFTKRMQEEAQREKDRQIALMKAEERKLMMENQMMKDALEKQGVSYTSPTSILPGALPTTKRSWNTPARNRGAPGRCKGHDRCCKEVPEAPGR